jgi:hypothetical protein
LGIDTTQMGQLVARMMESIEKDHPDADMGDVVVIAEIQRVDEESGDSYTTVRSFSTSDKVHVQLGIIRLAQISLEDRDD